MARTLDTSGDRNNGDNPMHLSDLAREAADQHDSLRGNQVARRALKEDAVWHGGVA